MHHAVWPPDSVVQQVAQHCYHKVSVCEAAAMELALSCCYTTLKSAQHTANNSSATASLAAVEVTSSSTTVASSTNINSID
eukprot:18187-Heterococcus_DN1.PRE.1